jgi:hypothetical protein
MGIWIERQLEFVGRYRINLATTALVQLLASRHPALMALQVSLLLTKVSVYTCSDDSEMVVHGTCSCWNSFDLQRVYS